MFPERIETDRLRLLPRTPDHVDYLELYEHCSDGEDIRDVTQYLTWSPHSHPRESLEFLEDGRRSKRWTFRRRSSTSGIGDHDGGPPIARPGF